jgi:glycosyltransferase involved in cell wall biosynthesis
MMVKNEVSVIDRCLLSVRDLVDSWVICDTGSTDGTQDHILHILSGIPGELHEREWVNFGHNRSELIRLARGEADYLLLLDADITVSLQDESPLALTADSYLLRVLNPGNFEYWMKYLVRGDRDWWYEGVTHEYLTTSAPDRVQRLNEIVLYHHADGGMRSDKFVRDRLLLSAELKRNPSNSRAVFYLAQTHRDLGDLGMAIELYERRAAMGGWDEEVFYSLYQAGVLKAQTGDWPAALVDLVRAWEYRPSRLEPLYELALKFRERRQYQTSYLFARHGLDLPMPTDALFIHKWVYDWGLLFEYSISAYWVGEVQEALRACEQLLAMENLPNIYRSYTLANYDECLDALGLKMRSRSSQG